MENLDLKPPTSQLATSEPWAVSAPPAPPAVSGIMNWATKLFFMLSSLKLAVILVVGLAGSLATATFIESLYDTPTAQYWVYHATWFYLWLFTFGVAIFCVAMSRYPWKLRHAPFLMAHAGIVTLLIGAWITDKYGLDGHMRLSEGESGAVVELNNPQLHVSEGSEVLTLPVRWIPPGASFSPIAVGKYDLRVDQFLSHADPIVTFNADPTKNSEAMPAAHVKLVGGPMRITQDYWLWAGDPSWARIQAGPARLNIARPGEEAPAIPKLKLASADSVHGQPQFTIIPDRFGGLSYQAISSSGVVKKGLIKANETKDQVIHPGWKGDVVITLLEYLPHASTQVSYKASQTQYGDAAPSSAIHIIAGNDGNVGGKNAEVWLGLGDRAMLHSQGKDIGLNYSSQHVILPFSIRLDRFTIETQDGTRDPASYASTVTVEDQPKSVESTVISMNEPLKHSGLTFYQASYEDAQPRPVTSILSVNRDPGRIPKYLGSLLLVLGSILLFAMKYYKARVSTKVTV